MGRTALDQSGRSWRTSGLTRTSHVLIAEITHGDARPTRRRMSSRKPRHRGPSVAVRETADGAHRPSWRHPRPSAMRPWTPQHNGLQRYRVTHTGTEKKRPASARIRSWRAVFAGGGRCWVRTNVG